MFDLKRLFAKKGMRGLSMPANSGRVHNLGKDKVVANPVIDIVYGVEWRALDGMGTLAEQANKQAATLKFASHCVFENTGGGAESLVGMVHAKVGKRIVLPAAAIFAMEAKSSTALYIGPSHDGKLALIGLLQGMPSPSYDKVGTPEEILDLATEYQQHLAAGAALYFHRSVGTIALLEDFLSRNFASATVVDALPGSTQKHAYQRYAFVATKGRLLVQIGLGLVLASVFGGIGYIAWDYYATQLEVKERQRTQAALDLQAYVASRDTAFKAAPTLLASQVAPALWQTLRATKDKRAGWRLGKVECTGGSCTNTYSAQRGATFAGLVKTVGIKETYKLEINKLGSAEIVTEVPLSPDLPEVALMDAALAQAEPFVVQFGTTAQLMNRASLTVNLQSAGVLGDAALAKKLKNARQLVRNVGTWSISGSTDTFVDAMRRLPANASLSSVNFVLIDGGDKFEATGRYFTQ